MVPDSSCTCESIQPEGNCETNVTVYIKTNASIPIIMYNSSQDPNTATYHTYMYVGMGRQILILILMAHMNYDC